MTLAVDILANAIRANPRSLGAAALAERYLRALHAAGYVIKKRDENLKLRTGADFAHLMSALMGDIISGRTMRNEAVPKLLRAIADSELGQEQQLGVILNAAADEIDQLRVVLRELHDWHVEYARINNLFNSDGSPATFHELLAARRILEIAA